MAVGFAAADTYVIVQALPEMMSSVGLRLDQLEKAAPIVSGFLLGYVAILPLIGRVADLRGRLPVLVGCLLVFSIGSLVTACAFDLVTVVAGRFLQGVGGGGLVPATFALVADIYVAHRRGVPLGIVGAVQELGSVVGPLFGAVVLELSSWHAIFWINLAVGLVLAGALAVLAPRGDRCLDLPGLLLALAALAVLTLLLLRPESITRDVTWGLAYVPYWSGQAWTTPLALALIVLVVLFCVRELFAEHPVVNLRGLPEIARQADLVGALLLAVSLAGIVVAFASSNPEEAVLSARAPWLLAASAVFAVVFVVRQRRARHPLVPTGTLHDTAAWGSVAISFFIGAALIAALVDIPVYARTMTYTDDQLGAALVLVRFLVALPIGALVGGFLTRRVPLSVLSAIGTGLGAVGFLWMSMWGPDTLDSFLSSTPPLVIGGFGFGLAVAPVNAALLAATRDDTHALASALLVVARMVGMLVGISVLTTIGMRAFYSARQGLDSISEVCGSADLCDAYSTQLREAGMVQVQAVFWGAAFCSGVAALLSLVVLRHVRAARDPERGIGGIGL